MTEQSGERRRFHRIATDKEARLRTSDGAEHAATVLDVSLRGLLLEMADAWTPTPDCKVTAHVQLTEELSIDMDGKVAHIDGRRVGIQNTGIDLDSASRLRRMVELNLDDHALLERNLAELING